MMKSRILFAILVGVTLAGSGLLIAGYLLPHTIHARIAEQGGFSPDFISARVGQPLRLRLVSEDVDHTFAVGQYPMDPVPLEPHQPVEITLTFDEPGKYTFYSTTPSSLYFWRMRGTIEVSGPSTAATPEPPLYVRLGLSLEEEHEEISNETDEEHFQFHQKPSVIQGEEYADLIDPKYLIDEYYYSHSPMEIFESIKTETGLGDETIWDMVAYVWGQHTSPSSLANGEQIYRVNCAACHGDTGEGDGQFADEMKAIEETHEGEEGIEAPTDFSEPEHLLEAQPAVLQGLILRGGMGTGMPMWGSIFTDEQTWDLVDFLYSFQFDFSKEVQ